MEGDEPSCSLPNHFPGGARQKCAVKGLNVFDQLTLLRRPLTQIDA
jgi:hypothetical protein